MERFARMGKRGDCKKMEPQWASQKERHRHPGGSAGETEGDGCSCGPGMGERGNLIFSGGN